MVRFVCVEFIFMLEMTFLKFLENLDHLRGTERV